jgi:MoaA/NifB/PqqE/SkfB family radical SAM enzyme
VEVLCKKLARIGVTMLSVIGGEPFVRKDIFELVRVISRRLVVQVTTNGWFVDPEKAARIFRAGVYMVNVSLDSPRPEVHNRGRNNSRAFERAIRAIEALRDAPKIATDQRVTIETILSGRNVEDLEEMVALADGLGVSIVFQPYSAGHIADASPDMEIRGVDISRRLSELKRRYRGIYNNPQMIGNLTEYFERGRIPGCLAGRACFNIDAYGQITRCEEQRRTYGNAVTLSFAGIKDALERVQRDTLSDGCSSCYLRTRGETEPLYGADLGRFIGAVQDMFGVDLPRLVPQVARLPGTKPVVKHLLRHMMRLGVLGS